MFAIAPVDGQYKPAGVFTPIENVNYMVIHGSHDGDVSSFNGLRAFQRIQFTDGKPWFKTAWYVYRANHGQWNTVWGNKDNGPRSGRYLDLRGLITPEEQRQFSKVMIGAFMEATLHGKSEYLPMFRDHRVTGAWLPKTMYITRFEESGLQAARDVRGRRRRHDRIRAGRDAQRRQSRDVEREPAQSAQRAERSDQHPTRSRSAGTTTSAATTRRSSASRRRTRSR